MAMLRPGSSCRLAVDTPWAVAIATATSVNHASSAVRCSIAAALAIGASAQSFSYPNFASIAGLTTNGAAAQSGTNLRITNGGSNQVGSVWYTAPIGVAGGFETVFEFALTNGSEGMAFVIQGSPNGAAALGGNLFGLGYGFGTTTNPITNSIAIEIDAQLTRITSDTTGNEVSIHSVGALGNSENEGVSIARVSPAADLSNGNLQRMRVTFVPGVQGVPGTLSVFLGTSTTALLTAPWSFQTGGTQLSGGSTGGLGLAGNDAWVGFTASTPVGTGQNAELRSWNWTTLTPPVPCYTGNVRLGQGGPYDLLTINNGIGGFFRTAQLTVADPWTISLAPPPGMATAPFVFCGTLGIASAATVTPTPFGTACFPLTTFDIGSFIAPYTASIPPGIAISFPLTFQAVMATDPAVPATLELTNAIAANFTFGPAPAITSVTPNSAVAGGTITIAGANFSPFITVDINGIQVTPLTLTSTQITFAMPAGLACGSTLRVRNPDGVQVTRPFNPVPTITNQVNTSGPAAGGASFIVIGTGFAPGTTITIGGNPANVTSAAATVLVATTPPGTPGPAQVVIRTPGNCQVTGNYTYL
jgi:hypothetical protein